MNRLVIDYAWSYLAVSFGLTLLAILLGRLGIVDHIPAQPVLTAIGALGIAARLHVGRGGAALGPREAWAFALFATGIVAGYQALALAMRAEMLTEVQPAILLSGLGLVLLVHFVLVRLLANTFIAATVRQRERDRQKKG